LPESYSPNSAKALFLATHHRTGRLFCDHGRFLCGRKTSFFDMFEITLPTFRIVGDLLVVLIRFQSTCFLHLPVQGLAAAATRASHTAVAVAHGILTGCYCFTCEALLDSAAVRRRKDDGLSMDNHRNPYYQAEICA